jgi:hypothetical protein
MPNPINVLDARLLGESDWIAVTDVCQLCLIDMTAIVELVELGVVVSAPLAMASPWLSFTLRHPQPMQNH